MAVRGAHRSNLQMAVLLGAVSLYVDLPAFVATADAARRRGLWFGGVHHCAGEYLARHDAADMYGRPSPGRAPCLCRYLVADLWATALHLLFLFMATIAAARDHRFADVVQPEPERRSVHHPPPTDTTCTPTCVPRSATARGGDVVPAE